MYGITSEAELIDIGAINAGCDTIDAAAEDYISCGNQVNYAGEICNSNALSIDNVSLEASIEELGETIKSLRDYIESFTSEIRRLASSIYQAQSEELAAYRAEQARLEAAKQEAEANKTENTTNAISREAQ